MKIPSLVLLFSSLILLAGCGKKESASPAAPGGPKTFEITANDTMKYSVTRLEVAAGEDVKVVLTNTGTQPRQVMGHNWVLLQKDADPAAFVNAAATHQAQDYFPAELAGEVLARINLLGPRQSGEVEFKAPAAPGEYPFLCTFPGHFLTGMKGVLVVH
ncbi:MAG: plastocyanin/azurin family copper-binding protein [Opitutaceae bacterium]